MEPSFSSPLSFFLPKAVIFDVDGTLYNHKRLRWFMLYRMLGELVAHPRELRDLMLVRRFRRMREALSGLDDGNLERRQYAQVAAACDIPREAVRAAVDRWMYKIPLAYLRACRYAGLLEFLETLRRLGVKTAVLSDYPAAEKLLALNVRVDLQACALDPDIDRLKPHPRGLHVIAGKLGLLAGECLFIGDRDDKDGKCARRAGMHCLILDRARAGRDPGFFGAYSQLTEYFANGRYRIPGQAGPTAPIR